jgi:hypothetical protein
MFSHYSSLTFFAPWLTWQLLQFWIFSTPQKLIFLQSFMKSACPQVFSSGGTCTLLPSFKWDDMIYKSPSSIGSLFLNCPIRRTVTVKTRNIYQKQHGARPWANRTGRFINHIISLKICKECSDNIAEIN